jgi:hypothetical protein
MMRSPRTCRMHLSDNDSRIAYAESAVLGGLKIAVG